MEHPLHTIHPIPAKNSLSLSPGEWLNSTGLKAHTLGKFAHDVISQHFETKMRLPKQDYYFDNSSAGRIDKQLCDFIIKKNPTMTDWEKREIKNAVMQRPDILVHSGRTREYYEIKPDSIDGMLGGDKIYSIALSMDFFNLPYKRGISFVPDPIILIGSCIKKGKQYDFHFVTGLVKPGLITYRLCVSTDVNTNITFDRDNNVANYFKELLTTKTGVAF